ncbi:MAG: hypothetical protein ACTSUE_01930 [Promethearchaeota archaeon]
MQLEVPFICTSGVLLAFALIAFFGCILAPVLIYTGLSIMLEVLVQSFFIPRYPISWIAPGFDAMILTDALMMRQAMINIKTMPLEKLARKKKKKEREETGRAVPAR